MAGDMDAVSDLVSVSSEYLAVAQNMSSTELEYAREVAATAALMKEVESSVSGQLSEAEQQLAELQNILLGVEGTEHAITDMDAARAAYEAAQLALDTNTYQAQIDGLQATLDALNGVDTSVTTLSEAQAAYESAQLALDNNWYTAEIALLEGIKLGIDDLRDAYLAADQAVVDAGGASAGGSSVSNGSQLLESVTQSIGAEVNDLVTGTLSAKLQQMMDNGTYSNLAAAIAMSAYSTEIKGSADIVTLTDTIASAKSSYGFASGGSFTVKGSSGIDNLSLPQMRVTSGEMINVSRPDVMSGLQQEFSALREELKKFRQESRDQSVAQIKTIQKIERHTSYIEHWDFDGIPAERVE